MSIATTRAGEIGEAAAEGIGEIVGRVMNGANVATYIEGESPLSWDVVSEAGLDLVGVDDGEDAASLRDLVEIGLCWGHQMVALPLITTLVVKRHCPAAAEHDGPLTVSIPTAASPTGWGVAPYGQTEGILLVEDLAAGALVPMPEGEASDFDPVLRTTSLPLVSSVTQEFARELQAVWAAEAAGVARRALDDAVAFVKEREQFGRPIGSFQAVKHHLATAHMHAEQALSAAVWASLEPEHANAVALHGITRSLKAVELALQVHGGLGFTWEMGVHFSLRHLQRLRELVGGLSHA